MCLNCLIGPLTNLVGLVAGGLLLAIAAKGPVAPIGGLHSPVLIVGLTVIVIELYILYRYFRQGQLTEKYRNQKEGFASFSHSIDHSLAHRFEMDPNAGMPVAGALVGLS